MSKDIPLITPRQRYDVTITDSTGAAHTIPDAGFTVASSGAISVTAHDQKHGYAWAAGFWASASMVASDG